MVELPKIMNGEIRCDERGCVSFCNAFNFDSIQRFYHIHHDDSKVIRAFHGHMKEEKYVYVVNGEILFSAVYITDPCTPSDKEKVHQFVLSAKQPQILFIPASYANGFRSLTDTCDVLFFSTVTLQNSLNDDVRFDPYYWGDVWQNL
ncbi:sugar epimerase [Candidatus Cerribacteria bacterium 'Amazon FNV 2010 28 9']|uniref:Sugar epimerase n=1 Tax=Candidatus Cerribacteria bacterium 'Amazon FNV 2010 28 9' TaxID=2081795 RepID=A0A317JMN6_9BACT|nr:MAG: sugar epimerase [Candidatus Cerribacteria bacterium 'Amazon FNV 2010 28 9']